uniref:Odorant-binding protein 57d2 n=1 Tax=Drosophila biarmipes TaxID=125945 RepID=B0M2D7_DROBM|nr:odorant-binding protein 57d2 [Drosophila biarmipes]
MIGYNAKNHLILVWLLLVFGHQFGNSEFIHPCNHHNGITEEVAHEVLKVWPGNLNLASVNRTHKCYVTCIFLYYSIVSSSGDITLDKYYNSGVINEYAFTPTLRRCIYEKRLETDYCEHTFGMFNCFRQGKLKAKATFNK